MARMARSFVWSCLTVTVILAHVSAWGLAPDEARHLLHRTGFGVSDSQWHAIIDLEYDAAVDKLVDDALSSRPIDPPDWVAEKPLWTIRQRGWSQEKRRELRLNKRAKIAELREWWIIQMLTTSTPLRERMTLFWSNHFTTQYSKSFAPMLMYRQHALIRQHALGRFDALLLDVLRDPAMLLYLDNDKNFANSVNENLARELMELFTLGEGHYSEEDVKEAARCLTGWGVSRETGEFSISTKRHDTRTKTVLGEKGRFDGDGLARVLLDQPATSERVVRKLWLEFISFSPDEALISGWAEDYRASNFDTAKLLKAMFKSAAFRDENTLGQLIKSPVELYMGLMRPALDGLDVAQTRKKVSAISAGKRLPRLLQQAGQNLFEPPTVEGWPGGLEWIDSRTLLSREQTARNLVMGLSTGSPKDNRYLNTAARSKDNQPLVAYLNALDPVTSIPQSTVKQRLLLELIRDPVVHVK